MNDDFGYLPSQSGPVLFYSLPIHICQSQWKNGEGYSCYLVCLQIISFIDRFIFGDVRQCTEEEFEFFPADNQRLPHVYLEILTKGMEQGNKIYNKLTNGLDYIVYYKKALEYSNEYAERHMQEPLPNDYNRKYFHSDHVIEVTITVRKVCGLICLGKIFLNERIPLVIQSFSNILRKTEFDKLESLLNREAIYFLIVAKLRCILLSFRRSSETFVLFDSHSHGPTGAIIAFSRMTDIQAFSDWILKDIFEIQAKEQYAISSIHISTEPKVVQSEKIFLPRSLSSRSLFSTKSTTSMWSVISRPFRTRTSASCTDETSSRASFESLRGETFGNTMQGSSCAFVRSNTTGNFTRGSCRASFGSSQSNSGKATGDAVRPMFYVSDDDFEKIDMPSTSQTPPSTSSIMVPVHVSSSALDSIDESSEISWRIKRKLRKHMKRTKRMFHNITLRH